MPHLGVATLTGVAPDSIWQGRYLLKGLEYLRAYGTVAPGAAGRTFGAALKLIDSATRADYGVDIGRCIGLLFHCVSFSSTGPWLRDQILSESLVLLFSVLHTASLSAGEVPVGMKASVPRLLIHLPHGHV